MTWATLVIHWLTSDPSELGHTRPMPIRLNDEDLNGSEMRAMNGEVIQSRRV